MEIPISDRVGTDNVLDVEVGPTKEPQHFCEFGKAIVRHAKKTITIATRAGTNNHVPSKSIEIDLTYHTANRLVNEFCGCSQQDNQQDNDCLHEHASGPLVGAGRGTVGAIVSTVSTVLQ